MIKKEVPLLAIDGGGTKTIAVITDEYGYILKQAVTGATNYQSVGIKTAGTYLFDLIQSVVPAEQETVIKRAVFAMAGIDTEKDRLMVAEMIEGTLARLQVSVREVIIENDCLSALLGATGRSPGALLIAGTGSIAYAHNGKGVISRAGGWGHQVGDEGSGYWIAKEAVGTLLKEYDRGGAETILLTKILRFLSLDHVEELYNWVYSEGSSANIVSRITPVVAEAFREGDMLSKNILERASAELADLLADALKKAELTDLPCRVILQGGVLQHIDYVRDTVINAIKEEYPKVQLLTSDKQPISYIIQRGLLALQAD
ncbi:N-acetylglucosamine kinase [Bacillus sp. 1P06AnD]|uniref:N-acetylglucosamine kinase n=1 Tax=Bacillus sp. 1P06AnD TaxID=3132208 RepID=UPI00399F7817